MPLGGEQEYHQDQYSFEIPIPSDILNEKKFEEKLGAAGAIISAFAMGGRSHISWSVKAELDVPMMLDVKKAQDIVISQ